MEWIVAGVLFAIVTLVAAHSRGHSGLWFFAGLLLGPIGLIWVLVLPKNEANIAAAEIESGDSKRCPFCAETIKLEALLCKHCGKDQPPIDVTQLKKSWTCQGCRAISKGHKTICWNCDKPMPAPD